CQLELEDSREKGYLVVVRAIRIDWDHGKTTVLITSLPRETVGASLVVKAYFDRWPHEELQFRSMKSFACLNRVAGYGKKKLSDETVRAKQKELGARITEWRKKLAVPSAPSASPAPSRPTASSSRTPPPDSNRQTTSCCGTATPRAANGQSTPSPPDSLPPSPGEDS